MKSVKRHSCVLCGAEVLPDGSNFSKRAEAKSGYQSYCTTCYNSKHRLYRAANPVSARSRVVQWRRKNPDIARRHAAEWQARNPEKSAAQRKLRSAVRWGKIKRGVCIVCGSPKTQGHHEDYSKPLDVIWLCHQHHTELHHGQHKGEGNEQRIAG
jgi:hypothetical protein